jgi:thioredoxin reductase (NADPH)
VSSRARPAAFVLSTRTASKGRARYRPRNVVVATGYFDSPNLLGVPGRGPAEGGAFATGRHVFYDQDCVVVGGGNSAVDAALELHRWGARVTIVHFAERSIPT